MPSTVQSEPKRPQSMQLDEALNLTLNAGQNVDGHWRQFYTFLFGLLAWLSSTFVSITRKEALIISLATGAFFAVNAIATVRAHIILRLLILETRAIADGTKFASPHVEEVVRRSGIQPTLPHRITITVLGNIAAAAAIMVLLWRAVR